VSPDLVRRWNERPSCSTRPAGGIRIVRESPTNGGTDDE
jgi:hypothetical protein